jgi:hypothetical protein
MSIGWAPLTWIWSDGHAFWRSLLPAAATHALISAMVWALAVRGWAKLRAPQRSARVMRAARGVVITETLIVLLPFMLLTSGLAQMTMNSMAGVLTNLAAYQAGRTMWVYNTSANAGKGPAKARLAAAASVAPVASGSMIMVPTNNTPELDSLRAGMFVSFMPILGIGGAAMMLGGSNFKTPARMMSVSTETTKTFDRALDNGTFSTRAARKLTFAHECIKVTPIQGNNVGARVEYKHYQAFPWFGWIFGSFELLAGRPGYYSTITRTYELPQQVTN